MSPPPIVYLHSRPFPSPEANTGAVMQMCSALAEAGSAVRLVSFGGDPALDPFQVYGAPARFDLVRLPVRDGPLSYPTLVFQGLRGAPRGAVVLTRIPQVALYAMALGRRTLLEMHYPIASLRRGEGARALLDRLNRRLAGVIVISEALASEIRRELPRYRGPILTAPSGSVDLKARAEGAPPPDHDVGFVGSFYRGRGVELVLEIASRLPHVRFLIVGGPASEAVSARAATLPNVTLAGRIDPGEVARAMARFRIGLAPYAPDIEIAGPKTNTAAWMSPMKIIEYLSAEKTVVASRFAAIEELVRDGVTARLAPPEDVDAWVAVVAELVADRQGAAALAARGRAAYEARLTWRARATAVLGLL